MWLGVWECGAVSVGVWESVAGSVGAWECVAGSVGVCGWECGSVGVWLGVCVCVCVCVCVTVPYCTSSHVLALNVSMEIDKQPVVQSYEELVQSYVVSIMYGLH